MKIRFSALPGRAIVLLAWLFIFASSGWAEAPDKVLDRALLYAPAPEFPRQPRFDHVEGTVRLHATVDRQTGTVSTVSIEQSSGHQSLDNVAVRTLRQWRLKPQTLASFSIPFTFILKGGFNQQLESARTHALFSPSPKYPLRARCDLLQGEGIYRFEIDYDSGLVRRVETQKTTGSGLLDQAAVKAFRQWRFVPRSIATLTVPLRFSFYDEEHTRSNSGR